MEAGQSEDRVRFSSLPTSVMWHSAQRLVHVSRSTRVVNFSVLPYTRALTTSAPQYTRNDQGRPSKHKQSKGKSAQQATQSVPAKTTAQRSVPTAKNWSRDAARNKIQPKQMQPKQAAKKVSQPSLPPKPRMQRVTLPPVVSVFHLARILNVHMRKYTQLTNRQIAVSDGADWAGRHASRSSFKIRGR